MSRRNITSPAFFPMFVNLRGKKCVVVGAGKIAAGKIDGLLAAGADVVVVSPRAVAAVQHRAQLGGLVWLHRNFRPEDLDGALLAVAATNSQDTNEAVFSACRERGVLCNAVDDPAHCDFIYPAVVRRGNLQIAVSTGGKSPALAARLRRELEQQFGPEWGDHVERLGRERETVLRSNISARERKRVLLDLSANSPTRHAAKRRRLAESK